MRYQSFLLASLLSLSAVGADNIVVSNDDGWAELNIRQFYDSLIGAGNSVIISAPAENKSGTGSKSGQPSRLKKPCEFDSCPKGSPSIGHNASMPTINYVNSYPVTAMHYGVNSLSRAYFRGSLPDIALSGPNVGANAGLTVYVSGTVGAAVEAAKEHVPAIAFSGTSGSQIGWKTTPVPNYSAVYAELSTKVTQTLIASAKKPYLQPDVWLNVNFPAAADEPDGACGKVSDFTFVLSRIFTPIRNLTPKDVQTCDNGKTRMGYLPTEEVVLETKGCYASVSVGRTEGKSDASASQQGDVLGKLKGILGCLPPS